MQVKVNSVSHRDTSQILYAKYILSLLKILKPSSKNLKQIYFLIYTIILTSFTVPITPLRKLQFSCAVAVELFVNSVMPALYPLQAREK